MSGVLWVIGALAVGLIVGAWITKHPDEARGLAERIGAKLRSLVTRTPKP